MTISPNAGPDRARCVRALDILVAEDQALVAADIAGTLREIGHRVVGCVNDGQSATDAVRAGGVEMVLMDINMPGRSGLSAAAQIVSEFGVPVVMLTAYADRPLVEDARAAGASGYVVKPAAPDQLRVAIDMAHAQWCRARDGESQAAELERKLEERKLAERAKWVVVKRYGVGEAEAWELLQKASRATRTKLADVARGVLQTGELPGVPSVKRRLYGARRDDRRGRPG